VYFPTSISLVRIAWSRDERKRAAYVRREWAFTGEDVLPGADLDGAVAAGGADEFLDRPAGAVFDEPGW
jgi:hypothetical protein